ncbi:hypothetical protein ABEO75_23885 [Paenibacillus macerans]|uniref:hypothetical protein n=1 Tax=Paenibacillus macerans TaxID=44252 RepID=UPI002E1C4EE0|nr:hypothetical protein [Paenibacillus macerans]
MDRFPAPKLTALLPDKPLRAVEPRLYECLTRELRRLNLHPYDVKAGGQASGQGVAVYVRYGERFDRLEGRFFTWDMVENQDKQIGGFMRQAAEQVKKTLIAEYYKKARL